MEKRGIKEWIIRSVILVIGLIIAHFGVTLFLLSNLGADPFNVFVQGLYRILGSLIPASLITYDGQPFSCKKRAVVRNSQNRTRLLKKTF
ncbi:MAG: hypothetical protein J5597_01200 [Spirochaetaceae bacterium]|nr:hypothetical protein [Spirochaetaceae bacterium]